MEKNKKKEELQTRRMFFKKAAKSAIPILVAIAFTQMPFLSNAHDSKRAMGCSYNSCSGGCASSCYKSCSGGCHKTCKDRCDNTCTGCDRSCQGYCISTCNGSCYGGSR